MDKQFEKLLTDRFVEILEKGTFSSVSTEVLRLQKELMKTLSEEQIDIFLELDKLIVAHETDEKESLFRYGVLEGIKMGGVFLENSNDNV